LFLTLTGPATIPIGGSGGRDLKKKSSRCADSVFGSVKVANEWANVLSQLQLINFSFAYEILLILANFQIASAAALFLQKYTRGSACIH